MQAMEDLLDGFEEPQYQYIGFWPRLGALFIDGVILMFFNWFLGLLLREWGNPVTLMLLQVAIPVLYNLLLEYRFGATLGKTLLKLRIVNYQLQPPSFNNILLRNIIYIGMQFISLGIELTNYFNIVDNGDLAYGGISNLFTMGLTMTSIYGLVLVVIYIVELVFLLTDPKFRSLHDRIGKTYVVKNTH